MSLLVWTRALDDWHHDKPIIEKLDVEYLHLPCIELQGLSVKFPRYKPQIFVFTSANAVRYSAKHYALVNLMRSAEAVYAIGPGTGAALKDIKVNAEVPPNIHNAEELAVWLSRNLSPDTHVSWPSAREPSYNLGAHLARYAIEVDVLPVYHTEKSLKLPNGKQPDVQAVERYVQSLEGVVCFASPSAVDGFVKTLSPMENRLKHELVAMTIGSTTKAAAEGHFEKVMQIPTPSIELLAKAAAELLV